MGFFWRVRTQRQRDLMEKRFARVEEGSGSPPARGTIALGFSSQSTQSRAIYTCTIDINKLVSLLNHVCLMHAPGTHRVSRASTL